MRYYYNQICSIYRTQQTKIRGSSKTEKIEIYSNIKCSIWSTSKKFGESKLALESDGNFYEINLKPEHNEIKKGDIISIEEQDYLILNYIKHYDHNGKLDNIQVFVKILENA